MRPRSRWFLGLAMVALVAGLALALPVEAWIRAAVAWIRGAGVAGVVAYAALYVAATLLFLPASVLTLGAGLAYGPLWGTVLVSPASVLAATAAFQLGRTALRPWAARRAARTPRLAAIDAAIGARGLGLVLLLRLSPLIPFSVFNYTLGLTRVRLRDFVLGSLLGMLPWTVLLVYLGSLAGQAATPEAVPSTPATRALYWIGLAATVVVVALVTRAARRALVETLPPTAATPPAPPEVPP